jgi:Glycosyl hydrolase family 71/PA14 domain
MTHRPRRWLLGLALVTSAGCSASNDEADIDAPTELATGNSALETGNGLTAEYFPSLNLTGTAISRVDPTVDFDWASGSPMSGIGTNGFSVRWTGDVLPLYSETYTFTTSSDDGIRLWVDGQKIVDNWTNHATTDNTGTITLVAGKRVPITLEFYENTGSAVAKLAWSSTRQAKQIVPQTALFPTSIGTASGCYAFNEPTTAALRASPKKAFAFYYPPFPISIDNRDPAVDQWQRNWLDPNGSNGMYKAFGGYTRDRPIPRPIRPESNWRQLDFEREVRYAIAAGLDGFIYEHPDKVSSDARQNQLTTMLAAARAVDPDFKIILSPDFPTTAGATTDGLFNTISAVADHPSVFKLPDGRIVLSTYHPERQPVSFWTTLRDRMAAAGKPVAFVPVFASWNGTGLTAWNDLVYGYSSWGGRTVSSAETQRKCSVEVHNRGRLWMSPVAFEDVRFKTDDNAAHIMRYWESQNSGAFRAQFEKAFEGNADWISLTTWNDYSESWMSPSRERGFAVVDLAAYYVTWFKTGQRPAIVRDALYYFHRKQRTDAAYDTTLQTAGAIQVQGDTPSNQVELVAFLKEPGRLTITQGTDVQTRDVAAAGMESFRVPIVPGTTPMFELSRNGQTVQRIQSATPIQTQVVYQDMMYKAGGGLTCARPDN